MKKDFRIKAHSDFVKAARSGFYYRDNLLIVQCCGNVYDFYRVGFTASKKVGNAVVRNRCKRRLRVVAEIVLSEIGNDGKDYVFIAKNSIFSAAWNDILDSARKSVLFLNNKTKNNKKDLLKK